MTALRALILSIAMVLPSVAFADASELCEGDKAHKEQTSAENGKNESKKDSAKDEKDDKGQPEAKPAPEQSGKS